MHARKQYIMHDIPEKHVIIFVCDNPLILASDSIERIRWLYCVECPQYSTRLEALAYL